MLHIEIDIPRPFQTLVLFACIAGLIVWIGSTAGTQNVQAALQVGGPETSHIEVINAAEDEMYRARIEQEVLKHREEVLRYQLRVLENERRELGLEVDEELEEKFRESTRELVSLIQNQKKAEERILASLRELWEAQGRALSIAEGPVSDRAIRISWPVEPLYGISAGFFDEEYEKLFGMPHEAVDIPALQGTTVVAVADGVVSSISDNGLGFNSLIISHDGFATLYGHVESFLVEEGDRVFQGDPIALSGGRPGSPGAGALSTGPHVHLEVIQGGRRLDPLDHLPRGLGDRD